MLKERSIRDITVRELCESAQINRATFYCHYLDIYDLKEQLENELLQEFEVTLNETMAKAESPSDISVFHTVFSLLKDNSDLCVILLSNSANTHVISKFAEVGKDVYKNYFRHLYPAVGEEKLDRFYIFVSSGCIALLRDWMLKDENVPANKVADEAYKIVKQGLNYLN